MYLIILGIFPIMVSTQVLVTDLIDAVNNEGKLIKYLEEDSTPFTGKVYNYYNNGTKELEGNYVRGFKHCLLYTSPSPRDRTRSRMPSSA